MKFKQEVNLILPIGNLKKFLLILLTTFFGGLLDYLTLGALVPVLKLVETENKNQKNNIFYENFFLGSDTSLISSDTILFLFLFFLVLSILMRISIRYLQCWYVNNEDLRISSAIFKQNLNKSFHEITTIGDSEHLKRIASDTLNLVNGITMQLINLFQNLFIFIFILIFLIQIDKNIVLFGLLIFASYFFVISTFLSKLLNSLGNKRFLQNTNRYQKIRVAFGSIRETKLYNLENYFINQYIASAKLYFNTQKIGSFLEGIHRLVLELYVIILVFVAILFFGFNLDYLKTIEISTIGVFIFGLLRILPAMVNIFSAISAMTYNYPVLNRVVENFPLNYNQPSRPLININQSIAKNLLENTQKYYLSVKDLTVKSQDNVTVLDNVSFSINSGSLVGIVGSSGAGKSSLLDALSNLRVPYSGAANIHTKDSLLPISEYQPQMAFVPQESWLMTGSLEENIKFGLDGEFDIAYAKWCCEIACVNEFIDTENDNFHKIEIQNGGQNFSGGEKQRICIARALYRKPKILFLDEVTSGLDIHNERKLIDNLMLLTKRNCIILFISHRIPVMEKCEKIIILHEGQFKGEGKYSHLLANNTIFKKLVDNWGQK